MQMALDELLFEQALSSRLAGGASRAGLRFYYASEPWISLGYAYSGWKNPEVFPSDSAAEGGIPVCRRLTGGGRVLHGRDLMFTLIADREFDDSFKSVRISYLKLHEVLKEALEVFGVDCRFYRCDEALEKGRDCFRYPIATDLEAGGKKIAGGGQKRSQGVLMHQESIQVSGALEPELWKAFLECFCQTFGTVVVPQDWDPDLLFQAERIGELRYRLTAGSPTPAGVSDEMITAESR